MDLLRDRSVVAGFIEYFEEEDDYPLQSLRAFDFTFACEVRDADGLRVIGTGGKLLEELKVCACVFYVCFYMCLVY